MTIRRRLLPSVVFAALLLAAAVPARAESGGPDSVPGEVVVSVWSFVTPGMPEKRGCRIRVVIDNHTPLPIGFAGKFTGSLKGQVLDAWLVSTSGIAPKGSAERLYSCVMRPDRLELTTDSPYGYPQTCEVSGQKVNPCPFKARVVSNAKEIVQP